jgi:site-specific DNA recombinase
MTKRAVIYARVSTDEQADKGYSLPTQLEACEKYARANELEIVGTFNDDYTGAVPLEMRPEGRKAYDMLHNGQAEVLVAYRIDRIVRPPEDGDEWDMPVLIRGLAKLGREIHTVNRGQLKTDFASLLIAMLDARKAGEERRDIVERTTRGRNQKAKGGKVVGSGKPLYGFEDIGGAFAVVESEARIVRLIYKWYVENGKSDKAIAHELSTMGIKTPGEAKGAGPKHSAGVWRHTIVRLILKNEAYCGVYHYGKVIGSRGKGGARPADQHIKTDVPPIVSCELWQAAQDKREYNKQMSARNTKNEYLLRGMIKCGCGRSMCAHMAHNRPWYRCSSRAYQQ